MNYRLQDIMKMIILGLYLMALVLRYEFLCSDFDIDTAKLYIVCHKISAKNVRQ